MLPESVLFPPPHLDKGVVVCPDGNMCSMELALFFVFVCKEDLVHAAKKSFERIDREYSVPGLAGYYLKCQEVGITLWRLL